MTIETLDDAKKYAKLYPGTVNIVREVRYYADMRNVRYVLAYDWTIEQLEQELWLRDSKTKKKSKRTRDSGVDNG